MFDPSRLITRCAGVALTGVVVLGPGGCSSDAPPPDMLQPEVAPNPLPRYLRGTIRYEADLEGYGPALVQGFGLMVGLDGTGSSDTPVPIRAEIEREAQKMLETTRVSDSETLGLQALLDSPDTAVVLVEATIPPGAPKGTRVDVRVGALPTTSTTSLEGGRLWTTRLKRGLATPMKPETRAVALAKGDVFVNPFASIREDGSTSVDLRVGRIINGAVTTEDMPLMLRLRSPSYSRSRSITYAINARFPREPGQEDDTARPVPDRTDELIRIVVPPSWAKRTDEFVETLMHTTVTPGGVEARAEFLARWLVENPIDAQPIVWSWIALGKRALPAVQGLYDHAEAVPRLAALRAGAKMGDPLAIEPLAQIALDPDNPVRREAVELLGEMSGGPRVSDVLRRLLDDDDLQVRLAAFDGLLRQQDPFIRRVPVSQNAAFDLYRLPSEKPLVYVTQQDRACIAVFGVDTSIPRPLLVSVWNDRLILAGDDPEGPIRIFHRARRTGEVSRTEQPADLIALIQYLGATGGQYGPISGLGLTYGETVGVLYAMHENNALGAPLALQQDRLTASLTAGLNQIRPEERPESLRDGSGAIRPPTEDEPNLPPMDQ